MTIFAKDPIITLRLGSKYTSVIINLTSTSATQLCSKITKINEIFIVTPHFCLKLVQKLRKKVLIFRRSPLTAHKDKFMSTESPKQAFWLALNVTNAQKKARRYPQPCNLVPRAIFLKRNFFHLQLILKRSAGDDVAQLWSRDLEVIILI